MLPHSLHTYSERIFNFGILHKCIIVLDICQVDCVFARLQLIYVLAVNWLRNLDELTKLGFFGVARLGVEISKTEPRLFAFFKFLGEELKL